MEGRDTWLSNDWRGDAVWGVRIDGIDMVGIGVAVGCSETSRGDRIGGVCFGAGASIEGRGETSGGLVSAFAAPSSFSGCGSSITGSDGFTSTLDIASSTALGAFVACSAGLSGREPKSDEALESGLSAPLFTAFARRSCSREFGLLRDELRDA
jgi:hypothetical protein